MESSRLEEEGSGIPKAFVLGKGRRAPRGWEMALEGEFVKTQRLLVTSLHGTCTATCLSSETSIDDKTLQFNEQRNAEMLEGERAVFKIAPVYSYAQKGCLVDPPKGISRDAALMLDIQLVNFYRKGEVKAVGEGGVILRTLKASESWEHPRAPFEVGLFLPRWRKRVTPSCQG